MDSGEGKRRLHNTPLLERQEFTDLIASVSVEMLQPGLGMTGEIQLSDLHKELALVCPYTHEKGDVSGGLVEADKEEVTSKQHIEVLRSFLKTLHDLFRVLDFPLLHPLAQLTNGWVER